MLFGAVHYLKGRRRLLGLAARPIRFASKHTFTLYLSHSLAICAWQALVVFRRGDPAVLAGLALASIFISVTTSKTRHARPH